MLKRKESDNRYAAFFTEEQSIDVLILGSSHLRHGIFPMELWNKYGITSYNLAANGSTIPVSYWVLINSLDYKKPKVVVLDVFDIWPGRICSDALGQVHDQFDAFPLSFHKIQMILDIFKDKDLEDGNGENLYKKRWELLFEGSVYHTRWNELTESDFDDSSKLKANSRVWKGAKPLSRVTEREEHIYGINKDALKYDELSKDYLEKTIKLCKSNDIEILLINTGYDCRDEAKLFHDSVEQIAYDNGIKYIDLTKENIIDFNTDLDTTGRNTHVNSSGAQKLTKFLGETLFENYNLADHRKEEPYLNWWKDYDEYSISKQEYLKEQTEIYNYLMYLNDDDYNVIMEIRNKDLLNDTKFIYMINNLGVELSDGNTNLICIDVASGKSNLLINDYQSENVHDTILGSISYFKNENDTYCLHLNNEELNTNDETGDNSQIKIYVYSKSSKSWIDIKSF